MRTLGPEKIAWKAKYRDGGRRSSVGALESIKEGDISLVMMGIRMPGMNGLDALDKIQNG